MLKLHRSLQDRFRGIALLGKVPKSDWEQSRRLSAEVETLEDRILLATVATLDFDAGSPYAPATISGTVVDDSGGGYSTFGVEIDIDADGTVDHATNSQGNDFQVSSSLLPGTWQVQARANTTAQHQGQQTTTGDWSSFSITVAAPQPVAPTITLSQFATTNVVDGVVHGNVNGLM